MKKLLLFLFPFLLVATVAHAQLTFNCQNNVCFVAVGDTVTVCLLLYGHECPKDSIASYTTVGNDDSSFVIRQNRSSVDIIGQISGSGSVSASAVSGIASATLNVIVYSDTTTICFSSEKSVITLEQYMKIPSKTELQWYSVDKNPLPSVPLVDKAKLGPTTYYVCQKHEEGSIVENNLIPITVNVVYVPKPLLNMTDQKTCGDDVFKPFVATASKGCAPYWFNEDGYELQSDTSPSFRTNGARELPVTLSQFLTKLRRTALLLLMRYNV